MILVAGCCSDYASVRKLLHFGGDFILEVGFLLNTNAATGLRENKAFLKIEKIKKITFKIQSHLLKIMTSL